MGHIGAVQPNEARWMISAASVLPGVWACGNWSHLPFVNVTTLPVITSCNQQAGCLKSISPTKVRADPSVSLHLHQMKSTIINIIPPCYSVLFRSHSGYLPALLMACPSLRYLSHYLSHLFVFALRRTGRCSYCWRQAQKIPATTVIHSRPVLWPPSPLQDPHSPQLNWWPPTWLPTAS